MAVLLSDDFNRANSTTTLGSPVVGGPYTVQSGTWGINSNEAYLTAGISGAQVTFPAAINVDISAKMVLVTNANVSHGLMFRWVDANNFWVLARGSSGNMAISRCVAGALTQVSPDFSQVAGDVVGVKAFGDQIAWYRNGVQLGVLTDQWFATAGTVAGLRSGGITTPRFDDLLVQDQSAAINTWGASPEGSSPAPVEFGSTQTLTPSLYKGRDTASADESEIP